MSLDRRPFTGGTPDPLDGRTVAGQDLPAEGDKRQSRERRMSAAVEREGYIVTAFYWGRERCTVVLRRIDYRGPGMAVKVDV